MLAVEADGDEVTTIKGMANEDSPLGIIQAAFQEYHGLQCDFCTPVVIATSDPLSKNSAPSETEIRKHLDGNLCRRA